MPGKEYYANLEARVRALLKAASELPSAAPLAAEHYVDHREYGLAVDTLGDWAVEHDIILSAETLSELSKLYKMMGTEQRHIEYLRQRHDEANRQG